MRMKDVKTLWGRAANRCAFPDCRLELTLDSPGETLGEMAHIVARSSDGPRGASALSVENRDAYENLVLKTPLYSVLFYVIKLFAAKFSGLQQNSC